MSVEKIIPQDRKIHRCARSILCSGLYSDPQIFCLLSFLHCCWLDVRMGKWLSLVSSHSAFTPSVFVTMWPCVCHISCLIFLGLFFHSSVTMTAGWEGCCCDDSELGGGWTKNLEFGEQILMSRKCKRGTRPTVCGHRQPWATQSAMLKTQKELWLTAIKKCITLNLCQAMCLHYLNSQTYTGWIHCSH